MSLGKKRRRFYLLYGLLRICLAPWDVWDTPCSAKSIIVRSLALVIADMNRDEGTRYIAYSR